MNAQIVEDIDRPSQDVVDSLAEHSAADVHEAMGDGGAMEPSISLRTAGVPMCGPATTVRLPAGDNMMIHVGARVAKPGDVLVIAADTTRAATWGELATRNALRKGLAGVVSAGNVRDVDAVSDLEFPVFSPAVSQVGAVKETPGSVNIPVSVGDVVVNPGDIIVGDRDGVTVVPRERAAEVAVETDERLEHENAIRKRIQDGESLYDITNLDERVTSHGLQSLAEED